MQLPAGIYSPEQLKACGLELDEVIAWRRRQEIKQRSGIPQSGGEPPLSHELGELIGGPHGLRVMTTLQLEQLQEQIRVWLRQPVTHITFPVPPSGPTKVEMVKWFRSQVSPTALVKFEVNRNVVGGCVVRTPSRIFDFSFRTQLLKNKDRIPQLLKNA
jgi:hypothetical protein